MIPSLSIGPRTLLNDCNYSATAIFWRSAIFTVSLCLCPPGQNSGISNMDFYSVAC